MTILENIQRYLLHLVSHETYSAPPPDHDEKYFQKGFAEAEKFFSRFGSHIKKDLENSSFLDVGCGYGTLCIHLAERGAKKVTGVEIRDFLVDFANKKLDAEYPHLKDRVTFKLVEDIGDEKFDIAISKDSFEHYDDPSGYLKSIYKWLNDRGRIYLGFSPLWNSPFGGHMDYVTWFPWAHVIFPEKIMLEERKRLTGENITKYSDVSGGLNQMTLKKFRTILAESDYTPTFLETNISDDRKMKLFNILKRLPFCEEYFTHNAYTILRKK